MRKGLWVVLAGLAVTACNPAGPSREQECVRVTRFIDNEYRDELLTLPRGTTNGFGIVHGGACTGGER